MNLTGKTALVAGASRGIGLAIAKALAGAGACTVLAARSLDDLEREAGALREKGLLAEARQLDLADASQIGPFVESAPQFDIVVAVAGTNLRKAFIDYAEDEAERLLEINLRGIMRLTQAAGRRMIRGGAGGKVIFIGSLTSMTGLPYLAIYGVAKSALAGLTRCLAVEWGPHNIQVNCIAPGFILTDLNRAMWQSEEMRRWLEGSQANPGLGTPEDVAPLAVFLSGSGSDYITGQVIAVDGGYSTTGNWPFRPVS